jgi:signal transduction histidine kinase
VEVLMSKPVPRSLSAEWRDLGGYPTPLRIAPYVLLVLCFVLTETTDPPPGDLQVVDLVLCVLAAAWIAWMTGLHPAWVDRPRLMGLFIAVLWVILAVLVFSCGWFGFVLIVGYAYPMRLLPWPWRLLGVAAMGVLAGAAQTQGRLPLTLGGVIIFILVASLNVVAMGGLTLLLRNAWRESDRRRQAVEELSAANGKLEATLAENAGLHRQLLIQAREAGMLDERHRMAREIHDTLAQGLTGIITQLQAAEQAADEPAGWRRHFAAATALARQSLTEARRSVDALRPEPLETGRLGDALTDVAEHWSRLHGVAVQVTTTGTARWIRPEADFVLLRAAQEALANVAKHAKATRVGVTLSYMENEVALDVRDDGKGFDLLGCQREIGEHDGRGFGLTAMRQRVEGVSGTVQVESEPGVGTAISVCVPVGEHA